jgi:CRISPR locus-related DNA-binding protein
MVAIMGIAGGNTDAFTPTIKSTPDVTEVIVFCAKDDKAESKTELANIKVVCDTRRIRKTEIVDLKNPLNLVAIAKDMQTQVSRLRHEGGEIEVFNIAGGTRIMGMAALIVCMIEGIRAVYVHDDTRAEISLPLLQVDYSLLLNDKKREILEFVLSREGRNATQKEISEHMKLHKATVNHHIRDLEEIGAVRIETKTKDKRSKKVVADESMDLLIGVCRK